MTDLTLCRGKKRAAFDEMTVDGGVVYQKETRAGHAAVTARYAEVHAMEDREAQRQHPDYADYDNAYWIEAMVGPALRACWAGEGKPPTDAEIRNSRLQSEVNACLRAVVACNPVLATVFPGAAPDEEDADPNA